MKLRNATASDIDEILLIINDGKKTLKEIGIDQWQGTKPNKETISADIEDGNAFVCFGENGIFGYAVLQFGIEQSYSKIYDGKWQSNKPYATIHTTATSLKARKKGVMSFIVRELEKICLTKDIEWVRIDTHEGNIPMRSFIVKNGFAESGTVYLPKEWGGGTRIACEKNIICD